MLTCKEVNEKASTYYDHELGLYQKIQFKMHLLLCRHCRQFIHNFKLAITMSKHKQAAKMTSLSNAKLNAVKDKIKQHNGDRADD